MDDGRVMGDQESPAVEKTKETGRGYNDARFASATVRAVNFCQTPAAGTLHETPRDVNPSNYGDSP